MLERSLLNYMPYVLSCPTFLVAHVLPGSACLLPYVLSCLTCLVPYVLSHPTWLVPYVLSYLMCPVIYVLSCLTFLVLYVLLCFRCLASYVASCLMLYVPFFLAQPIVSYHAYSIPNIIFCELEFPCIALLFFLFICYLLFFGGNLLKLKTNIVC